MRRLVKLNSNKYIWRQKAKYSRRQHRLLKRIIVSKQVSKVIWQKAASPSCLKAANGFVPCCPHLNMFPWTNRSQPKTTASLSFQPVLHNTPVWSIHRQTHTHTHTHTHSTHTYTKLRATFVAIDHIYALQACDAA